MKRRRTRYLLPGAVATVAVALSFTSASPEQSPNYLTTTLSYRLDSHASNALASRPRFAQAYAAPLANGSSNSVYFKETAHYLKDAFLNYWLMYGGVRLYGYPISEEFTHNGVSVQYFERSRFEYNPGSTRPWKVELTNVGSLLTEGRTFPPATETAPTPDRIYFEQTRHTVGGVFRQFWQASGGLEYFGFPISEEMQEEGRAVQYFERARFELTAQGRVHLGRLGADMLDRHIATGLDAIAHIPRNRPGFNMTFRGEATIFRADWERVIRLNKQWGNLPPDFVGRGLYAAAPADLGLYGRWARVSRGNRSVFVQFIDVINWPDIPYVRNKGIVIDISEEAYRALGVSTGGRYVVSVDVFWPGDEP